MIYFAIVSLFNGLFALFAGLYVLLRNRGNAVYVWFSSFAIPVALWSIFYAVWQVQTEKELALFFMQLTMAFCMFVPFGFFRFALSVAEDVQKTKYDFLFIIVPTIFAFLSFTPLMIPDVVPRLYFPYWPKPGILMHGVAFFFFGVMVVYGFYLLCKAWIKATGVRRWQLRWITLSTLAAWIGGSTNWFLWYDIPIPPIPNIFVAVCFLLMAYAVIRRQLFDVDTLADIVREARLSAIGTLAASINHEIRNPLFVAKGFAESFLANMKEGLLSQLTPEERERRVKEILEKTVQQVDRAIDIMRKFSEFSKPRIGPRATEEVKLGEVIESVLSFLGHEFKLEKIRVENSLNGTVTARGDRKDFEEIFLNLILNACQAMPNGGIIKISEEKRNGNLLMSISDTGEGIPPDKIKRIFEPFYSTKEEKGSGLGLYIVKKLVERNRGEISIQSEIGEGSTFILNFKS